MQQLSLTDGVVARVAQLQQLTVKVRVARARRAPGPTAPAPHGDLARRTAQLVVAALRSPDPVPQPLLRAWGLVFGADRDCNECVSCARAVAVRVLRGQLPHVDTRRPGSHDRRFYYSYARSAATARQDRIDADEAGTGRLTAGHFLPDSAHPERLQYAGRSAAYGGGAYGSSTYGSYSGSGGPVQSFLWDSHINAFGAAGGFDAVVAALQPAGADEGAAEPGAAGSGGHELARRHVLSPPELIAFASATAACAERLKPPFREGYGPRLLRALIEHVASSADPRALLADRAALGRAVDQLGRIGAVDTYSHR